MIDEQAQRLDNACRDAIARFRLQAFDNIDLSVILSERLAAERARWIGRHLLLQARRVDAYEAGQHILRLVKDVDVA